jgi:hypothetical protein
MQRCVRNRGRGPFHEPLCSGTGILPVGPDRLEARPTTGLPFGFLARMRDFQIVVAKPIASPEDQEVPVTELRPNGGAVQMVAGGTDPLRWNRGTEQPFHHRAFHELMIGPASHRRQRQHHAIGQTLLLARASPETQPGDRSGWDREDYEGESF